MKKSILLFIVFFFTLMHLSWAQEMTPEMQAFIAKIDGASLADIEAELDQGIKGLRSFIGFFDGDNSERLKDYSPEEEEFDSSFSIDTSVVAKALIQFENMGFQQSFSNGKSLLKFEKIGDRFWNTIWMEEGMAEGFTPKAIYYKDGSKTTEGITDKRLSFFFPEPWSDIAIIDSVAVDYTINYTAKYDSLLLTKKSKKIKYKDGIIKVKKLEKNYLYVTVSDAYADGFYVNALNAEGKVLNSNSSSFSPTTDNQADDGISQILKVLEEVQDKLKKKAFKDTEELKTYLLKKVAKIEEAKDSDGVYHKKYYFQGNIETVKIFIETEGKSKTISFTAKNNSGFGDIIFMQNKTHNIFYDAKAKELFRDDYSPIQSLGSRYFQNDSLYYHLNLETKKLDQLQVNAVWEASNGLAFIRETEEANFLMYDADLEILSEIRFENLYTIDNDFVQGISKKENYILDAKGTIKKLDGITEIRDPFDGKMAAKSNGKYGFISHSGEVVIPFIYTYVKSFQDGLAIVSKENDLYGLIDTTGKTIIPMIYSEIHSFENGIVWVSNDSDYQLIDKTGKVLVTAKSGSYAVTGSGSDKTYTFNGITYDAFGKLIPKE